MVAIIAFISYLACGFIANSASYGVIVLVTIAIGAVLFAATILVINYINKKNKKEVVEEATK